MTALALDVRELTFDEVTEVAGGPFTIGVAIVAAVGTVIVAGIAAVATLRQDDCVTTVVTEGNTTTTTKTCT